MNPNDIVAQMLGLTTQSNTALSQGSEALGQVSERVGQIGTNIQTAGTQFIEAQGNAAKQQAAADYATKVVHENAQRMVGLDPEQINNELAQSLASINEAKAAQDMLRTEWQGLQQTDFMTNPIGYVLSQFKSNDVARKHNAALEVEQAGYQNIQQRTQLLQQVKSTVTANTADTLQQAALAKADADKYASEIKLMEAEQATISKRAGIMMQQLDIAQKQFGNQKDMLKFTMDASNFAEMRQERAENRALRAEQLAYTREQRAISDKQKADKAAADAEFRNRLSVLSAAVGRPGALTPETLKTIKDPKLVNAIVQAADTMTFGATVADGVALVSALGDDRLIKSSNPGAYKFITGVATSVKSRKDQLVNKVDPKTGKAPKPEAAFVAAGDSYQAEIETSVSSPKATKPVNSPLWDNEFNPLRAQYESVVDLANAGKIPGLEKNLVVLTAKSLMSTKQGAPLGGADETLIFKTIAEQVKAGTLSPATAAQQTKQFYDVAAAHGADLFQYDRYNLPVPKNYYMQIGMPNTVSVKLPVAIIPGIEMPFGSTPTPVDMRSTASLERAFATYAKTGNSNIANMFAPVLTQTADILRGYPLPK